MWHKETCEVCGYTYRTTYRGKHPVCISCKNDNHSRSRSRSCSSSEDSEPELQQLKMYHGTSWEIACTIEQDGFQLSEDGRLGPGVYVARYDKAHKFALAIDRHGGDSGGMVEVIISFRDPKYVPFEDDRWLDEGYDACRADQTAASTNMEWCVASADQVQVLRIWEVDPDDYDEYDDDADEEELRNHD
mmetsp:Transcript_55878/g.92448  ORF Transcript_55878/g.92448 Transcript_55878/m.92448 type:complete len:189 (+) Transcript_55878:76-642(+)